jgi:hypothetical protein
MRRLEEVLHDLAEQDERLPTGELITRIERGLFSEGDLMVVATDGRSAMDAPLNTRQDRRKISILVAAGAALLMLIVVGLPILLFGGESIIADQVATTVAPTLPSTTVAVLPSEAPTSTAPTTTTLLVMPTRLEITWNQAPTQPAFGLDDVVWSVVEGGPGLVAVGGERNNEYDDYQAVVWTSVDGSTWERAAVERFEDVLNDVAVGSAGFVAVSSEGSALSNSDDPPVMFSEDGESWARIPSDTAAFPREAGIMAVTDGGPGYVAVGGVGSPDGLSEASIWSSTDGVSWTRVDQDLGEGYESSFIEAIVNTGSGLVAVGTAEGSELSATPQADLLVWTSLDGLVWERKALSSERGHVVAVAAHGESVVAIGYEGNFLTAWVSADTGGAFSAQRIPGSTSRAYPLGVLSDGDRLIAVGVQFPAWSAAIAWTSEDGSATWYEVTREANSTEGPFGDPNDSRPAGFRAVTLFGDGFVAVGGTGNGSAPVWIGTWNEK